MRKAQYLSAYRVDIGTPSAPLRDCCGHDVRRRAGGELGWLRQNEAALDSLPHKGAVIKLLTICGLTINSRISTLAW
jgi:hypothetical protein